ncbi:MAG: rhodanese-like domain-containing protein [Burkholderiaceae bacterium]|nr:rhodanese-like domain-containing protein [Burkholderiaceae bacterium]
MCPTQATPMTASRQLRSLLVLLFLALFATFSMHAAPPPFVQLEDARNALEKSSMVVIDIREPSETATGVAKGAKLIPMSQLGKRLGELPAPGKEPFLLICNTQNRSSRVAEQLIAAGYTNVKYVQSGMSQWSSRGWPMVKP